MAVSARWKSGWAAGESAHAPWIALGAAGLFALWFAAGTQREKPVLASPELAALRQLEADSAAAPNDAVIASKLANAYLDNRASGVALGYLEELPPGVRADTSVRHAHGRALFLQGRATDALKVERELDADCQRMTGSCSAQLLVSVAQRVRVLDELAKAGVEDANAHPEAAQAAFQRATHTAFTAP
jgi:hypothetical protein